MLTNILPDSGYYAVIEVISRPGKKKDLFKHHWLNNKSEVLPLANELDARGKTVYFAQASYIERGQTWKGRTAANVQAFRTFWLDIDCGPGKPYSDQKDGASALKSFCTESGLPMPLVVRSGGGLYAYWCMDSDIPPSQWKTVAEFLKQTLIAYEFHADPSRTSDQASILRPPGTTNRKLKGIDRPVRVINSVAPLRFVDFLQLLSLAAKKRKVDRSAIPSKGPKKLGINDQFGIHNETYIDAEIVASKCAQLWHIKNTRGNVEEPLWYAGIGILRYSADPEIPYEWSSGHPDYSYEATEAKIQQHINAGVGPTTCGHFASLNPTGCVGCKHKCKSPIQLGRPDPISIVPTIDIPEVPTIDSTPAPESVAPPKGFTRAADGLYFKGEEGNVLFYDRDLYPIRVAHDEGLGYETVTLRHHTAHDGVCDFTIRTALIHDVRSLMQALADNHVLVCGATEKQIMTHYIGSYTQQLQRSRSLIRLMSQMGWKTIDEKPAFVLGKNIYHSDGRVIAADLASNVPLVAHAFTTSGEKDAWVASTEVLDQPEMEPFAFALLAGAFGAPLIKFTGYEGATVSLVGDSGAGKTLVTRWAQSAYGYHRQLMMLQDDTKNSLVGRLGLYGSLPLTIDEITNIDPADLSDLIYRITQGRDKARLNRNAVERNNINHWNTLALVSTNMPLIDKLSGHKGDASAEINRIFEYRVDPNPYFDREVATNVYRIIDTNYGHVGEDYIKYLVANTDKHQENLDKVAAIVDREAMLKPEERFWSAVISSAIYGGHIAKKLGLIRFDVVRVLKWAILRLKDSKATKHESVSKPEELVGMFFDEFANNRLVVRMDGLKNAITLLEPKGQLIMRIEQGQRVVHISRAIIKRWCTKKNVSYISLRQGLIQSKVLVNADARKNLGFGTVYSGSVQPCWAIDIQSPAVGFIGEAIKVEIEELKKAGG